MYTNLINDCNDVKFDAMAILVIYNGADFSISQVISPLHFLAIQCMQHVHLKLVHVVKNLIKISNAHGFAQPLMLGKQLPSVTKMKSLTFFTHKRVSRYEQRSCFIEIYETAAF